MNPTERSSPMEPHSEKEDNIEGRDASLQCTSSPAIASSSQIQHLNSAPAKQICSDGLRDPHPSPLSLHPRNLSKGSTVSIYIFEGQEILISHWFMVAPNHIRCSSPFRGASISSDGIPFSPLVSGTSHRSLPVSGSPVTLIGNRVVIRNTFDTDFDNTDDNVEAGVSQIFLDGPTLKISDLKLRLVEGAELVMKDDTTAQWWLDKFVEPKVSIAGDPLQRVGAHMLTGLRAKLLSRRCPIFKVLRCKTCPIFKTLGLEKPTAEQLYLYNQTYFETCPHWKFAYECSNEIIRESIQYERKVHIIDFHPREGCQWISLMLGLSNRPAGPPSIRLTAFDDRQSILARGGGFDIVAKRLSAFAQSCEICFEFTGPMKYSNDEIVPEDLSRPGEVIVVNFPYILHQVGDDSMSEDNPRNRLLSFVKSLSPKVVTLTEVESDTGTSSFTSRFLEVMKYYNPVFESIDVASPCGRADVQRIGMEKHCLGEDIINMIACEGAERLKKHEVCAKWKSRLVIAGFTSCPLSPSVTTSVREMLTKYNENYNYEERDQALYLGWKKSVLASFSAWKLCECI